MTDQRGPLSTYLPTPTPQGSGVPKPQGLGVPKPIEKPTLSDIWQAGTVTSRADLPSADRDRLYDAYAPVIEDLNRDRSWFRRYHNPAAGGANAEVFLFDADGSPVVSAPSMEDQEQQLWAAIDARRQTDPKAFPDLPENRDAFHEQVTARAKVALRDARGILSRNDRWAGTAAEIGAGVATSFRDQYNIMSMPLGGFGRGAAMRIVTAGLVNAGVEGAEQLLVVADQRKKLGETLTAKEMATNVAAATVFGAGVQGLGEAGTAALKTAAGQKAAASAGSAIERGKALATAARERIGWQNMTGEQRSAVRALERDADIAATSPFVPGPGTEAHVARIRATAKGLAAGQGAPPAPTVEPRYDRQAFLNRTAIKESGGKWDRQADGSSAYGLWQITRGTFIRATRAVDAARGRVPGGIDYSAKLTDDQIWATRTNPAAQRGVMDHITLRNEQALARIGAPRTYGNMYLMHFAGESGAAKILRAAPDTPIERLLSAEAIAANTRVLKGKTAEDVVGWAHRLMSDDVHTGPVLARDRFDADEAGAAEWRAAQDEVDAAERQLAAVRADDAAEATPPRLAGLDDDVPFDLDDPRALPRGEPARDPFGEADEAPVGSGWDPAPAPFAPSRAAATLDEAKAAVRPAIGAELTNVETGITATLSGNSLSKMTSASAVRKSRSPEDHALAVAHADELFERSSLELSHPDRKGIADIKAVHRFRTTMDSPDGPLSVKLTVKEMHHPAQPNPLYSIEAVEVEPGRKAPADAGIERVPDEPDTPRTGPQDDVGAPAVEGNAPATAIEGFDTLDDIGTTDLMASLEHDLRMLIAEDPDATVRMDADGNVVNLADLMDGIDDDLKAYDVARGCLTPGGGE